LELIGIIDTQGFKEKVLYQRELMNSEDWTDNRFVDTNNEQIINLLTDIKEMLDDIKN